MTIRREVTSDRAMLARLIPAAGRDVVDIGCGDGALVRDLAHAGARVVGIEISEAQLAAARTAAAAERDQTAALSADPEGSVRARYLVGRAEALPLEDASMDLAVFLRTLHHVPPADLMRALTEARRVLRPDGRVYVAEPLAEGSYFELSGLVEDEIEVRAAAQRALDNAGAAGLERVATLEYEVRVRLSGVAAFHDRTVRVDPSRTEAFHAHETEIAGAFERLGEPGDAPGERLFSQPMRADVLRPARF